MTQANQSQIAYTYDSGNLALDTETISYDLDHDGTADFSRVLDRRALDAQGRAKGWELKDGSTVENQVTYGYHATEGRLQTVDGGAMGTFTYGYTANSNLIATVTKGGSPVIQTTNTWESTRNVLDLKENEVGSTMISSYDYTVNNLGQRTDVATGGSAFTGTPTWGWGYDALGQVVKADSSTTAYDRAYEFDSIGNRIEARDGVTTVTGTPNYAANALNQYTSVTQGSTGVSPVYDDDGNATAYPLPSAPSANSTLVWDAENRLISTTVSSTTTTYLYDAQARRIGKTTGSTTTLYLYDGWNSIAEYIGTTLSKTRTWGLDLSGSLQGAGGVGGLLAESQGSSTYYPTYDGNGNVSEYLTSAGAVAAHFEYDPFGNTVVNTDSGNQFSYRFSTKPLDSATGLYYYGYRYYDPVTGRWPSRDPIEEAGGINLYGFVGNDGVFSIDVLGLLSFDEAMTQGSDDAIEKTKNSIKPEKGHASRIEYCGLICKCSKTDEHKPTPAHAGSTPPLKEVFNPDRKKFEYVRTASASCDATFAYDIGSNSEGVSVSCAETFGKEWEMVGAYHSHPSNTGFSRSDHDLGEKFPYGKVTPDGKIEVTTGSENEPRIVRPATP